MFNQTLLLFVFTTRHTSERWQFVGFSGLQSQQQHQSCELLSAFVVQLVCVVAGPVVIIVLAGMQHQGGDAGSEKRMMIAVGSHVPGKVKP